MMGEPEALRPQWPQATEHEPLQPQSHRTRALAATDLQTAKTTHWKAATRVLRYLNGTAGATLIYNPTIQRGQELEVYVDASFNYCQDTRRSRTGYIVLFNKCPIHWRSTMQPIIATSSTEAEYVALMDAVKEAVWFARLLNQLGFSQGPVRIYVDNKGAIDIACNARTSMRTKHIDLNYHWIREQVEVKRVELHHVPGNDNVADMLTKVVARQTLLHQLQNIMQF